MYQREFKGINAFLVGIAQLLLKEGKERKTRGFKCFELPSPIMIKITEPTARIVTIPARDWNFTLPYVESLWLASGRNDIQMIAHYVKKMMDFSDNNLTMRAGYGPRFRYFTGISADYNTGYLTEPQSFSEFDITEIDQFEFVEQSFKKDIYTRQAVITIGDPPKDCFETKHKLKQTKDFPCTRDLQFIKNNNKLDLIVTMRSNDFVWGASGVNIFNFTFIQEYFASILGLPIGNYYHIVHNLHYYDNFVEMVENIADTTTYEDVPFMYHKSFKSLKEFDERLLAFQKYEYNMREKNFQELIDFGDDFFNDWAKVLYQFNNKFFKNIKYTNPVLNKVAKSKNKMVAIDNQNQLKNTFVFEPIQKKHIYWRQYI